MAIARVDERAIVYAALLALRIPFRWTPADPETGERAGEDEARSLVWFEEVLDVVRLGLDVEAVETRWQKLDGGPE
jgi:hypothetical protein